ncbi:hypothetical protein AVEN_232536-1 [Araneus ventricosus]|uniref:Uncharacterized protein n=1 Tax=Araneus ventricosus TaxID=182803 RepID=A0A4Y2KPC3_ARAVE|nr:hypothetical protein AVEN_232536-1 [Araneus ventricosus]
MPAENCMLRPVLDNLIDKPKKILDSWKYNDVCGWSNCRLMHRKPQCLICLEYFAIYEKLEGNRTAAADFQGEFSLAFEGECGYLPSHQKNMMLLNYLVSFFFF